MVAVHDQHCPFLIELSAALSRRYPLIDIAPLSKTEGYRLSYLGARRHIPTSAANLIRQKKSPGAEGISGAGFSRFYFMMNWKFAGGVAHLSDHPIRTANEMVGSRIIAAMTPGGSTEDAVALPAKQRKS